MLKFNTTMSSEAALNDQLLAAKDYDKKKRQLQEEMSTIQGRRVTDFKNFTSINKGNIQIENTLLPSLEVLVLPQDLDDICSKSLNFTWECTDYEESLMLI